METKRVFISYSHDTVEHKAWVLNLANRLRKNGIDAILDQYELQAGADIPHFMETNLSSADKILVICTENYVSKANRGEGGVGYEKMILTAELLKRIDSTKILPLIRQQDGTEVPTFLKSKLFINFSIDADFEFNYEHLYKNIHDAPAVLKPSLGVNSFLEAEEESQIMNDHAINIFFEEIVDYYEDHDDIRYVSLSTLAKYASESFLYTEMVVLKLIELGYVEWYHKGTSIQITQKGKLFAYKKGFLF